MSRSLAESSESVAPDSAPGVGPAGVPGAVSRAVEVAVIGAGLIGRAWALVFARADCRVTVHDACTEVRDKLAGRLVTDAALLARHGLVSDPDAMLSRISIVDTLENAVRGVAFVQENGPENVDIKCELFAALDRYAPPDAILASSTSAIVASRFTADLPGRARCLVAHPVNPPHLVPLVELCGAPWTDPAVLDRAEAFYDMVGQVPIRVRRELDGFVLNRLQGALLAEAFRLVGDGVVSPEDLDKTVAEGLGLRWSFMGPFQTIELNAPGGIADYCERYTGFYRGLADDAPGPAAFGRDTVARIVEAWPHAAEPARLAALATQRDERLAALAAHKRSSPILDQRDGS